MSQNIVEAITHLTRDLPMEDLIFLKDHIEYRIKNLRTSRRRHRSIRVRGATITDEKLDDITYVRLNSALRSPRPLHDEDCYDDDRSEDRKNKRHTARANHNTREDLDADLDEYRSKDPRIRKSPDTWTKMSNEIIETTLQNDLQNEIDRYLHLRCSDIMRYCLRKQRFSGWK